jgi:hypothetical protein
MTLQELQALTYQAGGGGIVVDVARSAEAGGVVVRVRKKDDRNDEWLVAKRSFGEQDLALSADFDRKVRAIICEMVGALCAFEISVRLGVHNQPSVSDAPRIVVPS